MTRMRRKRVEEVKTRRETKIWPRPLSGISFFSCILSSFSRVDHELWQENGTYNSKIGNINDIAIHWP